MIKLHLVREEIEVVVNTGASALVVEKGLVYKLGIWKRVRKDKIKQGDGRSLGGNFVVNTLLKVMDGSSVLSKFGMDIEVLDIGNRKVILGVSGLTENGFLVDTQDRCLRNINSG